MFWRKKSDQQKKLFSYRSDSFRLYFRVKPSLEEPVEFYIEGTAQNLIDIGAGGLSFQNNGFYNGQELSFQIIITQASVNILGKLQIIDIDAANICHAEFKVIKEKERESIYQYVLREQKHWIDMLKG
ncbi:MAG: hypothetical protein HQK77_13900 [Desulfobacterales bacterium]|nr:hypothetical protein [Desulfobacterales bacterium]